MAMDPSAKISKIACTIAGFSPLFTAPYSTDKLRENPNQQWVAADGM